MNTLREAALLALGALEGGADSWRLVDPAISALKAALAEPACCCGEPTASGVVHRQDGPCYTAEPDYWQEEARRYAGNADYWRERLKTQQRGCQVCGIGANGETVGYVCTRSDCPTRVTCGVAP